MSQSRVLIIGAAGFVGQHLLQYLSGQDNLDISVTKLQSESIPMDGTQSVSVLDIDITDRSSIDQVIQTVNPTHVIHLAAQSSVALSWSNPTLTMSINVNGTLNLLDSLRENVPGCRILIVGSSEQYGKIKPEMLPIIETNPLSPENPYAVSKAAQEMIAQLYVRSYHMNIILVRAFNHIGPGQSSQFVVSDFSKQIAEIEKGLRVPIVRVGNLDAKRDFTDVRDIVRGYWMLLQLGQSGEIYNIGKGQSIAIHDILYELVKLSPMKITVQTDLTKMRPVDTPEIIADISKINKQTTWRPTIEIKQSLIDILDYWRHHI